MDKHDLSQNKQPKILVFSTNNISDVGIDLAGSSHMDYPTTVQVLAVPCSSGINPVWILHALETGFDGVFIAADGGDCPYVPNCTERTAKIVEQAQQLFGAKYDARRVKMGAICSVCSESFVNLIKQFSKALAELSQSPGKSPEEEH
jgi:coenzyme F420-reducing hydrogenase delta subunit